MVLVAADGEWSRFPLEDDGFLQELERAHDVRVFDAVRHGYPERMRKYRRPPKEDPGHPDKGPAGSGPGDAS